MLLYLGVATTTEEVSDNLFNLKVGNCFKLKRKVEILQWVEHTQKNKEETICRYELQWNSRIVSSNSYRVRKNHENDPMKMIILEADFKNESVSLGARALSPSQID